MTRRIASRGVSRGTVWLVASLVAGLTGAGASADLVFSANAFMVQASNDDGLGTFEVPTSELSYNPQLQRWTWSLAAPVDITNGSGDVIAQLTSANVVYRGDPQIAFGFSATAGSSTTTFVIASSLISFPTIPAAEALASAGLTLTDGDGTGGTLLGLHSAGGAYLAEYNGGTDFAELVGPLYAPAGGSVSDSDNVPLTPLGVSVSSMNSWYYFSVTANDLASGTSNYQVTPEPGMLGLLVVGLFVRRR